MFWCLCLDDVDRISSCWRDFCEQHGRISITLAENIPVCVDTCVCSSCTDDLRTRQEMTYLRSYVNKMLENHPHGDTFKQMRDLAPCFEAYVPPIPDPEEEEQTRAQKILYSILKFILRMIELSFISGLSGGSVRIKSRSDIGRENLPKYYEQLNQKSSELMDVLDCSKNSIWLETYMV